MTSPVSSNSGDVTIAELVERSREFVRTVWRKRRLFFVPLAITISLGVIIALASRNEYSASTKLLPYRTGPNSAGLAGLAGLAGIRLPSGSADQTITADLYPVIAQTLDFRISVAETPLRFGRSSQPITMIKYFEDHRSLIDALSGYLADLRPSAVSASSSERGSPNFTVSGANGDTLRVFGREYLKIVQNLDRRLVVNIDRKTSVISITGVMPAPYAAADLVQTASERLMQRIIDYEAKKAGEQLKFIEEQYSQARARYQQAQENLAVFADRNRSLVSPLAQVERDRLQSEFNVASDVYQQLSGELQVARIKKNQDTPVFTVLEGVTVPLHRSSPHPTRILLLAISVGLAAGLLRVVYESQRPGVSVAPLLEERTRVIA